MNKLILLTMVCLLSIDVLAEEDVTPDYDLLQIYDLALKNDPTYQQAEAARNAVLETRPQAIAQLLPFFSARGSYDWNYLNNRKTGFQGLGIQRFWDSQVGVDLSQPVFHWDYWVQLSQSDNQIAQAEADFRNSLQDLMVRTIQAYLDVLLAKDTLRFARAEKASLARQLEQAQQRFNVGLIAVTDVLEAQAGYDGARSREIFAKNEVDNRKEALREIVGDYEGLLAPLPDKIPLMKPEPLDIDRWAVAADNQNLAIVSAQNQVEVERKNIELQRSGHYPTVDVVGNYTLEDNASTFGLRGDVASIGVQMNLPLYQGGAVNSRTREATENFNAAKDALLAQRRAVTKQVKNAYRGVISTISQVEALRATVKSSKSALEATEAGFEVGTRTMVDVVNEQRNLFESQNNLASARNQYILNWVSLKDSASSLTNKDIDTLNAMLEKTISAKRVREQDASIDEDIPPPVIPHDLQKPDPSMEIVP